MVVCFYVLNGTVKDLTIDGATVTCFRGAALIGRLDAGLVEKLPREECQDI